MNPSLSILMPVYNTGRYLPEALECILSQTHEELELIVIDDGSTEPVSEIVREFAARDSRVRGFRSDANIGLARSLNIALDLARGELLGRMDADDLTCRTRFERQLSLLRDSSADAVFTWAKPIDENGEEITERRCYEHRVRVDREEALRVLREARTPTHSLIDPSMVCHRRIFEKIGYYDPELPIAQTYNYILRLIKYFEIDVVREPLYLRRYQDERPRDKLSREAKKRHNQLAMERAHTHTLLPGHVDSVEQVRAIEP